MITLKINNKDVKVPTINELSTDKFCKLYDLNNFTIIDYLSIVLDKDYKVAEKFRIKNIAFLSNQLYGNIPDYSIVKPKNFITVNDKNYLLNSNFTLGEKFNIEENGKNKKGTDLILFILAVCADSENHLELLEEIKQQPAALILPEAFFLLVNFFNGRSLKRNFSMTFKRLTKIKN